MAVVKRTLGALGGFIKKPKTLEKIGLAVKEALEKRQFLAFFSMLDYLYYPAVSFSRLKVKK